MDWSKETPKTPRADDNLLTAQTHPEKTRGEIVLHLDRLMVERQISLNDLAAKVGITLANLSKIKNNHITAMRFSTLIALCEALNCQVGDLMEYQSTNSIQ